MILLSDSDVLALTAAEISHLLMWKPKKFSIGTQSGIQVHKKLRFNQSRLFSRYIQLDDNRWVLIVGKPDKIDILNTRVEELKTFQGTYQYLVQEKIGYIQTQIYCWLTGLPNGKLLFYNIEKQKIIREFIFEQDLNYVKKVIETAFEIKSKIDFLSELTGEKLKKLKKEG